MSKWDKLKYWDKISKAFDKAIGIDTKKRKKKKNESKNISRRNIR